LSHVRNCRPCHRERHHTAARAPQGAPKIHRWTDDVYALATQDVPDPQHFIALFFSGSEDSRTKGMEYFKRISARTFDHDVPTDLATRDAQVHSQGPNQADVTEGSGGVWERLHYDWSDPNGVVLTTTDSNVWGARSGHAYTFARQPNGKTDVDVVVVREGKNIKGRVLGYVLGTVGKRVLRKAFANTVKAIEARNDGARAAELT
jgi:hypothetical protein